MRQTRQHETEISLPASPEEVWQALTTAAGVTVWYAPEARIDPRMGGEYVVSWGPGMEGPGTIEVFESNKHLRIASERKQAGGGEQATEAVSTEPVIIAIDFYLEPGGEGTTLRLVHSGFLTTADWDNEFNGTKDGWPIMLRILRYSLAKHRNEVGLQRWLYSAAKMAQQEAWGRFAANAGGSPEYSHEPWEYCVPWSEFGDGLVYGAFAERDGMTGISLHVVLYGDAVARIDEAAAHWKSRLDQLYAPAAVGGA